MTLAMHYYGVTTDNTKWLASLLGINFRFQSSSLNSVARCKTNRTTRRHSYAAAGQCLNSQVSVVMESSSFHWSLDSDSWTNVQLPISYRLKFHSCLRLRFPLIRYCFASCSLELATVTVECQEVYKFSQSLIDAAGDTEERRLALNCPDHAEHAKDAAAAFPRDRERHVAL